MEDDDEIHSLPTPPPNGRITVTVASAPPQNMLTLALPIQHQQQQKTPGTGTSGGGREDCWSEDATAVLIEAWGSRYLELSRGNLKQQHWKEVADVVNSRESYMKTPKTDIQCKNRIDTVKKKYKVEKAKIASGGGPSNWRFFDRFDELIGPTAKLNSGDGNSVYQSVPMGIPVGVRSASASVSQPQLRQRPTKRAPVHYGEDSDQENSADSSDGLPPESVKRARVERGVPMVNNAAMARGGVMNRKSNGGSGIEEKESSWGNSVRELTRVFLKIGEAYEQTETAKLQQMVEMEKQRMKFAMEMELQRMQFFMKTQMELSQLKRRRRGNSNNHHVIKNENNVNNNNNNNSDSSN